MATDLERLVVQLSADITRYERALNRANGVTNTRTRAIESRFKRLQSTASSSFDGIAGSAARAFAVIGGARGLKSLSDAGTSIDNSLKVAGKSGDELERVYQSLRQAALQNAAPIQSLVGLYGRLSLVQGELGVNSEQLEGFSKNIALALRVGGQSAQEASGALLQLSQALGSGVVRAEEFNSVLEGAPVILQAAANGIKQADGSVAKLRKIMLDGQLTSKAFFDGFQAGAPILEDKVAGSVLTIGQRLENLNTALIDAVRQFNASSGAADTFGKEIDRVAGFVSSVNFTKLVSELSAVYGAFNNATAAASGFLAEVGKFSGLSNIGESLVRSLGGINGKVDLFGGGLTISNPGYNTENEIQKLSEKRLSVEKEIQRVRESGSFTAAAEIRQLNGTLSELNSQSQELARNAINGQSLNTLGGAPTIRADGTTSSARSTPPPKVDLNDSKYKPTAEDDKKGKAARKERLDDYQKEVERIRERTDALNVETESQGKLNPLINDYGYAVQFAAAQQELTNAAIAAGKTLTPELSAEIRNLADAYALSGVAADKLAESQENIRDRQEEVLALQKDVTRGLVDDLIEGKSAADAFAGALKKIANTLLDQAFTSFFNPTSKGGIGGLGGIFKLLGFANGGYTGAGGKYQPAGIVHKGEYVVPKNIVDSVGAENIERLFKGSYANGGLVNPSLGRSTPSSFGSGSPLGVTAVYSPVIDARGASVEAVARLERIIEGDRRNFSARVENTVLKARASNKKGF